MISVDIKMPRKNFELVIQEDFSDGITGIFGPSGSGKTSLLQAIAGLNAPASGHIMVNFNALFDSERKINCPVQERQVGYVFQEGRLFPHLSVESNLRYGYKKNVDNMISYKEVVRLLNLAHILKCKPANISGGERQRTALGRALLSSPKVLLLDEPFSAQDANLRDQILPFLFKIHQTINIPILVVSHDMSDLLKLTHRLFVINQGRCLGHGDYTELLSLPKVKALVGSNVLVNSIEMKVASYDDELGLLNMKHKRIKQSIVTICDKCKPGNAIGDSMRLFLRSDDITLATSFVKDVSVHNQLQGTIVNIIKGQSMHYCIVDVGVLLSVELTRASVERMQLEIGTTVWCLFKSVALDVIA